jgi:hypothetical protein
VTKEQEIAYTENKFADVFMIYHRKAWQHEHVYKLTQIGWKYLVVGFKLLSFIQLDAP